MKSGAWRRPDDSTGYGAGRFPFGPCAEPGCEEAACFSVPGANDNAGARLVCLDHKPKHLWFVPFLGQQTKLFAATERWVLGGGGAGGSKTFAGARLWLKQHAAEHARWKRGEIEQSEGYAIFFRRIIRSLRSVITGFQRYRKKVSRGKWNQNDMIWQCECGFKNQYAGMENDDDWEKYYGEEFTLVVFDEAWQFTKKQILEMDSRIRCSDPVLGAKVQLYLLTNPIGSETKKWMKRRFVDVAPPETSKKVRVPLADGRKIIEWQVYIPSNLFDNPALMRDGKYEANLRKKSATMRRILLENDWEADEGSWVGDDWDNNRHVIDPHPIPLSWPRIKFGDYAFASKGIAGWAAVDPSGGLVIYRSYSYRGLTARDLGQKVKDIESRPLEWKNPKTGRVVKVVGPEWDEARDCSTVRGPMDCQLWDRTGYEGETRGEILESLGAGYYPSSKGSRVRETSADQIRGRLRAVLPDPFRDGETVPGIRWFRGTTENRMVDKDGDTVLTGPTHTLPTLPADPDNPDLPLDTGTDDHDWDGTGYLCQARPQAGEVEEAQVIDFLSFRERRAETGAPISW